MVSDRQVPEPFFTLSKRPKYNSHPYRAHIYIGGSGRCWCRDFKTYDGAFGWGNRKFDLYYRGEWPPPEERYWERRGELEEPEEDGPFPGDEFIGDPEYDDWRSDGHGGVW